VIHEIDVGVGSLSSGSEGGMSFRPEPCAAVLDRDVGARKRAVPRPPAEAIAGLEQDHAPAGLAEIACGDHTGEPASDHDHVGIHGAVA
jgi:hypothetical protein